MVANGIEYLNSSTNFSQRQFYTIKQNVYVRKPCVIRTGDYILKAKGNYTLFFLP